MSPPGRASGARPAQGRPPSTTTPVSHRGVHGASASCGWPWPRPCAVAGSRTRRSRWQRSRPPEAAPPGSNRRTSGTDAGAPLFPPFALHRLQEGERHQGQRDVVVPAAVSRHLVVVEADLALGQLEVLLDGPAQAAHRGHLRERDRARCVGPARRPALPPPGRCPRRQPGADLAGGSGADAAGGGADPRQRPATPASRRPRGPRLRPAGAAPDRRARTRPAAQGSGPRSSAGKAMSFVSSRRFRSSLPATSISAGSPAAIWSNGAGNGRTMRG